MESEKDKRSDAGEPEDIPSDFFDDFAKDDFISGLSVIDSWDDEDTSKSKINAATLDSVKDLRELIENGKANDTFKKKKDLPVKFDSRYKWNKGESSTTPMETDSSLDDFVKPGSRRDPSKTHEAIRKDKESKVKEYLSKSLESSDVLRPPGTELDDYYAEKKFTERKKTSPPEEDLKPSRRTREHQQSYRHSPVRRERSPRRFPRYSPRNTSRQSPKRIYRSPGRVVQYYSPPRKFRNPERRSPRWSPPRRRSPRRSPRRRRSRSPVSKRSYSKHSPSPFSHSRDSFLYPADPFSARSTSYPTQPFPSEYPVGASSYPYMQGPSYAGYTDVRYDYSVRPDVPVIPPPQPVPPPSMEVVAPPGIDMIPGLIQGPTPAPIMNPGINIGPAMVPAPPLVSPSPIPAAGIAKDAVKPYDALAQLVADGKLSKEDYLKLAPNKGVGNNVDPKTRVMVLSRCNQALTKLANLMLPTRLLMNINIIGQEPKSLAPKFSSPLKRQAAVEFQFTKTSETSAQQNKQLVDSIISTIGLDRVVVRPKKKSTHNMKDAAVQTTKPICEVCEIRESAKMYDADTSIDPEHFSSSIHTQVVEQDLISSKSIFNPTGAASDGGHMSIAHMTPAQLVSQLAARAKTLKQTEPVHLPNQFRRNPNNYDNMGGQYHNYNYRY